ncbi:hypothetical protein L198_01429 [Cryptococcus wingfieldii CBS 7118]|uniref:WIBG Mago-binding domain-containing protein n=1 Tax=Cryptococcus wingfieldii CBS 7118 TaxID=1295528 RepID=A0A1E3K135_9TREE|nr:hypothetical protein L198_01429 [Cryptococcus wingfieldii CBS 7118]ODO06197.1 hypothetical protein L198_01429 [Cryptococcus wingfieldii CBS 7118]
MATPRRNASGIILDPSTSQRVIPQSRRPDGTLRKEQKVRPGWTPQEDVGLFRSARRAARDPSYAAANTQLNTRASIPGSRPPPSRTQTPTPTGKDTDEDDLIKAMSNVKLDQGGKKEQVKTSEEGFPPLRGTGAPIDPVKKENETENGSPSTVAAIEPTPPGPSKPSDPAPVTSQKPDIKSPSPLATNHSSPSENKGSPSVITDRAAEVKRPSSSQQPQRVSGQANGQVPHGNQNQARSGSGAASGSWRSNWRPSPPAQQPAAGQSEKHTAVQGDGWGEAKEDKAERKAGGGLVEDIKKLA